MSHSQEEFGIHLAQALSYLHSRHDHIKTWAALFIGEQGGGPGSGTPRPALPEHPDPHPHPFLHCSWNVGSAGKRGEGQVRGSQGFSSLGRALLCSGPVFPAVPHTGELLPYAREGERERGKRGEVQQPPPTSQHAPCLSHRLYHLLPPPGRVPDGQ